MSKTSPLLPEQLERYVEPFRVDGTGVFRLASYKTAERGGIDKDSGQEIIKANRDRLSDLQEKLYAQDRWSLLLIFQGMDAAGKDSAIESVFDGVNPQGCDVHSFKQPSTEELDHDFMWRAARRLPERGRIGIFNRSYYEEVLVVRVHPEILAKQKVPPKVVTKNIWRERFEDISAFEKYLARNGTLVLKFFLNVSKEEQRRRFLDRLEEPAKNWKFSMGDVAERKLWDRYQAAYQDMIRHMRRGTSCRPTTSGSRVSLSDLPLSARWMGWTCGSLRSTRANWVNSRRFARHCRMRTTARRA
jgi:PPK2 family polyphosphate:nucleotide phosphotransferase